jgi:hypothetical protein
LKRSDSIDIVLGVNADSPTPIRALAKIKCEKFLATPVKAVIKLHKNTPTAAIFILLNLSPRTPINIPKTE